MKDENQGTWILAALAIILLLVFNGNPSPPPVDQSGPKTMVLLYETSSVTGEWNLKVTQLRAAAPADSTILVLDDDNPVTFTSTTEQAAWNQAKKQGAPAIVVVRSSDGYVLISDKLDMNVPLDTLLKVLK